MCGFTSSAIPFPSSATRITAFPPCFSTLTQISEPCSVYFKELSIRLTMTCTISCASIRARIRSSHLTVTLCPTDFFFKCETASLTTSSTSWSVSSSFRRPSFSLVTYKRFSTTPINHSESS